MTHQKPSRWQTHGLPLAISALLVQTGTGQLVHPGMLNSEAELDRIRERVAAANNTTRRGYDRMINCYGQSNNANYSPRAVANVATNNQAENILLVDAQVAYSHALHWVATGERRFAQSAIRIYNDWGSTLRQYGGWGNASLDASWIIPVLISGAEIIRHYDGGSAGWNANDIAQFNQALEVLYRSADTIRNISTGQNWRLSLAASDMAMGIFQDDPDTYALGRDFYAALLPTTINNAGRPAEWSRDCNHEQRVLEVSALCAEIAYQQGDNFYSWKIGSGTYRGWPWLALHSEQIAKSKLGRPAPESQLDNCRGKRDNGFGWESVLNHYKLRKEPEWSLPETQTYLDNTLRPHCVNNEFPGFTTLTHGDLGGVNTSPPSDPPTSPLLEIGEVTVSQNNGGQWHSVSFDQSFSDPVVIMGTPTFRGQDPMVVRTRNVNSNGFEFQLDEWDYLDGGHASEDIAYIVTDEGSRVIGGRAFEAGVITGVNHNWKTVTLQNTYGGGQTVLCQVASTNGSSAVCIRVRNVTENSFELRLDEEQGNDGFHAAETVHYLVVVGGQGDASGTPFQAGTKAAVDYRWSTVSLSENLGSNPLFFGQVTTFNGSDPCALRMNVLQNGNVEVFVEEERSLDSEIFHGTEDVRWFAAGLE